MILKCVCAYINLLVTAQPLSAVLICCGCRECRGADSITANGVPASHTSKSESYVR